MFWNDLSKSSFVELELNKKAAHSVDLIIFLF